MSRFTTFPDIPVVKSKFTQQEIQNILNNYDNGGNYHGPFTRSQILDFFWTQKYKFTINTTNSNRGLNLSQEKIKTQYLSLTERINHANYPYTSVSNTQELIESTDPRQALVSYATATLENASQEQNLILKSLYFNSCTYDPPETIEGDYNGDNYEYRKTSFNFFIKQLYYGGGYDFDSENNELNTVIPFDTYAFTGDYFKSEYLNNNSAFYLAEIYETYNSITNTFENSLDLFYMNFVLYGNDYKQIRQTILCDTTPTLILDEISSVFYTTNQENKTQENYSEVGKFNFLDKEIPIYAQTYHTKYTSDCAGNQDFGTVTYTDPIIINASYQKVQGFNFNLTN
jgi:hypothetical protein